MKLFFMDTETTGLTKGFHEIHQLSLIIQMLGVETKKYDIKIRPLHPEQCDLEALKIADKSIEEISSYTEGKVQFSRLCNLLDSSIDKYNKADKFAIVGYNVNFDKDFLREWFIANNHQYFGSYFFHYVFDVYSFVSAAFLAGNLPGIVNLKLSTVAEYFKIHINAHDAMSDIEATYELFQKFVKPYLDLLHNTDMGEL